MSRRSPPPFPSSAFKLLLVEGGDERVISGALQTETARRDTVVWVVGGQSEFVNHARLAALEPNASKATSVGVLIDAEESPAVALEIARKTISSFLGREVAIEHAKVYADSGMRFGAFLLPDGVSKGSVESLCRRAALTGTIADCVDKLFECVASKHSTTALGDFAWMSAYCAMHSDPKQRFYQVVGPGCPIDTTKSVFDSLRLFLAGI